MNNSLHSDQFLIDAYLKGDEAAFQILFVRHKNAIYNYILMIVREKYIAEEIYYETFTRVVEKLREGKYRNMDNFSGWVACIARNLCIDHFRRVKSRRPVIAIEDRNLRRKLQLSESVTGDLIKAERHSEVRKMIDRLPEEQREVVLMRHFAQLSFKEIAALMNENLSTTIARMRYALINLRKMAAEKPYMLS